jgi:hypothetical protein
MGSFLHTLAYGLVFHGLAVLAVSCLLHAVLCRLPGFKSPLRWLVLPLLKATAFVTPSIVPRYVDTALAMLWLLAARVAFFLAMAAYGLLPPVTT